MEAIAKRLKLEGGMAIAFFNAHGGSKVVEESRLFAVTQDIKVGDEVIIGYGTVSGTEFGVVEDISQIKRGYVKIKDREKMAKRAFTFKVLGELSPNATWVKEGEEIKLETDKSTGFIVFHGGSYEPNGRASVYNKANPGEYIKVKCPTCNTYH